jgi:hypothetical protein
MVERRFQSDPSTQGSIFCFTRRQREFHQVGNVGEGKKIPSFTQTSVGDIENKYTSSTTTGELNGVLDQLALNRRCYQVPGFPWPPGVKWASLHSDVAKYLRSFASWLGVNVNDPSAVVSYKTRVESVVKKVNQEGKQQGWTLLLRRFERLGKSTYRESWWNEVRGSMQPSPVLTLRLMGARISMPSWSQQAISTYLIFPKYQASKTGLTISHSTSYMAGSTGKKKTIPG